MLITRLISRLDRRLTIEIEHQRAQSPIDWPPHIRDTENQASLGVQIRIYTITGINPARFLIGIRPS